MTHQDQFPTTTDVQLLEHGGFTREQITEIVNLKERYQQETHYETSAEHKRQEFVRWLYQRGRLQS